VKIVAIVGPTASGKTDIAIALAQLLDGEIISADSRLVYKDFDIGTAKPTKEERAQVPHHLIDIAHPEKTYSVGLYKKQAEQIIKDITNRGKLPIIAGGTGFYVKAVLEGLNLPGVDADAEFRSRMDELAKTRGREHLHDMLKELDPDAAEKIHPNNKYRVIRALELCHNMNKPASAAQTITTPDYEVVYIGLNAEDREFLYDRINKRVDIMLEQGLVQEVENLINKYGKTLSILETLGKTLGYKEICGYLDGEYSLEQAVELIKQKTRNFAKRQLTWFRANKNIHWFYIDKMTKEQIISEAINFICHCEEGVSPTWQSRSR